MPAPLSRIHAQRTTQSTVPDLLLLLPEDVVGCENTGGGVNFMPGLVGTTTGGCLKLAVYPNCPAAKFCVPPALLTLIAPSNTCT